MPAINTANDVPFSMTFQTLRQKSSVELWLVRLPSPVPVGVSSPLSAKAGSVPARDPYPQLGIFSSFNSEFNKIGNVMHLGAAEDGGWFRERARPTPAIALTPSLPRGLNSFPRILPRGPPFPPASWGMLQLHLPPRLGWPPSRSQLLSDLLASQPPLFPGFCR